MVVAYPAQSTLRVFLFAVSAVSDHPIPLTLLMKKKRGGHTSSSISLVISFPHCNSPTLSAIHARVVGVRLLLTPRLYFLASSSSATVDRMMAPVSRARTSAPITLGFDVTRASVVSRSALLREGDDIGMDMAMCWSCCRVKRI